MHLEVEGDFTPIMVEPPKVIRGADGLSAIYYIVEYLMNLMKKDISVLPYLNTTRKCPDRLLPLLASNIGYEYNYAETPEVNRMIMTFWWKMYKMRGSEDGIKLAAALAVREEMSSMADAEFDLYNIDINYITGVIKIYYPRDQERFRTYKDFVRPAGMKMEWVMSDTYGQADAFNIQEVATPTPSTPTGKVDDEVDFTEVVDGQ